MNFGPHWATSRNIPPPNRSTGGIRIPFTKPQKPIPSKETGETQQTLSSVKEYHSSPQQQAARSQVPNLLWHSPRVCHQSTPSDWHRLSFPQKDGRIFWGNRPVFFQRPAFTAASQIFNSLTLANVWESITYAPKLNWIVSVEEKNLQILDVSLKLRNKRANVLQCCISKKRFVAFLAPHSFWSKGWPCCRHTLSHSKFAVFNFRLK